MMLDDQATLEGHRTGVVAEANVTEILFTTPKDPRTEAYITGRIG